MDLVMIKEIRSMDCFYKLGTIRFSSILEHTLIEDDLEGLRVTGELVEVLHKVPKKFLGNK